MASNLAGQPKARNGTGLGVDKAGNPVVDPTANVLALVEAEAERQDGLREAEQRYAAMQFKCMETMASLRADHASEIRRLETERLNSIRQVDVASGEREAKRSLDAVQTLAATTQANTEMLRNAVAATAQTIAKQTADTFDGVNARLAALERSSYEGKGKEAVSDPMLAQFVMKLDGLAAAAHIGSGASKGRGELVGYIGVAAGIVIAALALFLK